jgi:hypothetical protein
MKAFTKEGAALRDFGGTLRLTTKSIRVFVLRGFRLGTF